MNHKIGKPGCVDGSALLLGILIFMITICLAAPAAAGKYIISSIPDTIFQGEHSADVWDTIYIVDNNPATSHKLTASDQTAIVFGRDTRNWVMQLYSDTVIFGTDSSAFPYIYPFPDGSSVYQRRRPMGIQFGERYNGYCHDIIVRGGYFLNRPGGVENDNLKDFEYTLGYDGTNRYTYCFYQPRTYNITFKNVYAEIMGFQGYVLFSGFKNIWVDSCHFVDNTHAFTRRDWFQSAVIMLGYGNENDLGPDDYHQRVTNSIIEANCHTGIYASGDDPDSYTDNVFVGQIENCSLIIDTRNYLYPLSTPPTLFHSTTNGYAINWRSAGGNSYIRDNVIVSGENYNGGRGMFFQHCVGDSANGKYVDISGNYLNIHEGSVIEYPIVYYPCGVKFRRRNMWVNFHDNAVTYRADVRDTALQGYWDKGSCITFQFEMDVGDPVVPPYNIKFENNLCSALVVTPNHQHYDVFAASVAGCDMFTEVDTSFHWQNNYLYSQGRFIFNFGSYDARANYVIIANDTMELDDIKNPGDQWVWNAGSWGGHEGIAGRDVTYLGGARDTLVTHQYPSGSHGYFYPTSPMTGRDCLFNLQRTLDVYIKGNNGLPVVNAACSVWNSYGNLVMTGKTSNGGRASGVVNYGFYAVRVADTLPAQFNNFTVKAGYGGDIAQNTNFTVSWIPSGGTDTLQLPNTIGTGEWGDPGDPPAEEDTIPPAQIIDLGAVPGTTAGTMIMGWTAPGDDDNDGRADRYVVRYARNMISETNWVEASTADQPPIPSQPGNFESMALTGLIPGEMYYIAIRTYDEEDNPSALSNVVSSLSGESIETGKGEGDIALSAPAPGVTIPNSRPMLVVVNVNDSLSNIYYFEIALDTLFNQKVAVSPPVIQQSGDFTSWQLSYGLDANTTYYWHVRVSDEPFSAYSAFHIEPQAYAYPNPFAPASINNAIFTGIPEGRNLLLMSVSGEVIRRWSETNGNDILWDGTNENGNPVASDVYLWYVEGTESKGKLVLVR